jgi:hypothetical protein
VLAVGPQVIDFSFDTFTVSCLVQIACFQIYNLAFIFLIACGTPRMGTSDVHKVGVCQSIVPYTHFKSVFDILCKF